MRDLLIRIFQGLLKGLVFILFRPRKTFVSEKARQALQEPCIIISNHIRGFDGAAILTLLPGKKITGLVAKDMVDKSRALRFFFPLLPLCAIDREHASLSWLRDSRKLLREGQSIYMCPEGRCNFARAVRPFKPGFALLAASAGVKVVPIYHNGEYHPFIGRRFRMLVGEPITVTPPPEGLSEAVLNREADAARAQVQALETRLIGFTRVEGEADAH